MYRATVEMCQMVEIWQNRFHHRSYPLVSSIYSGQAMKQIRAGVSHDLRTPAAVIWAACMLTTLN